MTEESVVVIGVKRSNDTVGERMVGPPLRAVRGRPSSSSHGHATLAIAAAAHCARSCQPRRPR